MELSIRPRIFQSKLPVDCVHVILAYLPIQYVVNASLAFASSMEDFKDLMRARTSIVALLRNVVPDPKRLLYHMKIQRCIITGSQAAQYFCPGSASPDSDWDFFVGDSANYGDMLMALSKLGAIWEANPSRDDPYLGMSLHVTSGSILNNYGKSVKIQLINTTLSDPLDGIINFHSTPVQCFIAWCGAVHMYGTMSSEYDMLIWEETNRAKLNETMNTNHVTCKLHQALNNIAMTALGSRSWHRGSMAQVGVTRQRIIQSMNEYGGGLSTIISMDLTGILESMRNGMQRLSPDHRVISAILTNNRLLQKFTQTLTKSCVCLADTTESAIAKYISRGYRVVKFEEHMHRVTGWYEKICGNFPEPRDTYRVRSIGDDESIVIPIEPYTTILPDGRVFNKSKESIHASIRRIKLYVWFEYYGGTVSCDHRHILFRNTSLIGSDVSISML
jgi:hypothetical protein